MAARPALVGPISAVHSVASIDPENRPFMQTYPEPVLVDFVTGDDTGLRMPAHAKALRAGGSEFLTEAFRAYGVLPADNRVIAITRFDPCDAGNSGDKLFLSVEYARPQAGLHNDLFVKFSRDFGDAFRDRRRMELAAEIRLAALSRLPAFPVSVAKPYFADIEQASGTGILITQRIAFGEAGIEPVRPKNMDHELANPLEHYQATLRALARLAAAHRSGMLSPEVDALFAYDAGAAAGDIPIPWDEDQIREKARRIGAFVTSYPQLFPPNVASPRFLVRLEEEAVRFRHHEPAIKHFLHTNSDFIALTHWNTHLDNAWFWRDDDDTLQCGLLDWGMVRQMNITYGLWGGLSAATPDFFDRHLDDLLALYAKELRTHGGPVVDLGELELHFELSVVMLCVAIFFDTPALVLSRMPDIGSLDGPLDPRLAQDSVVHGFLHGFTNFLYLWETRDFGATLDALRQRARPAPAPPIEKTAPA